MNPLPAPVQLPLHEWTSLRSELVWIYDRAVDPRYRTARVNVQPGYRAWLIRRGSVAITSGRRRTIARPGTWVMLPETFTEQQFSSNAHIISVSFLCQWPSGEGLLRIHEPILAASRSYPALERDAQTCHRLLRRQFPDAGGPEEMAYGNQSSDYMSFLRIHGLFQNWLADWFHCCMENAAQLTRLSSGDTRPFQAARCLNQAPLDRAFPAEWLQRETGLGLMRLNQLFFREFGLTTRKYWDRRRLDFARQCLETSAMPIKEISYRLNFRSDSHFVIWFRRLTGSRPGDYRRTYLATVQK